MTTGKSHPDSSQSVTRLTSVMDTLRTEGLGWVLRRLRYRTPLTPAGRAVQSLPVSNWQIRRSIPASLM